MKYSMKTLNTPPPAGKRRSFTAQQGFTLIELVMVIVILGALAAIAVPKYVDLKADARAAALKAVAGAINSASAINYVARSGNSAKGVATAGLTCYGAATAVLQGGIPTGYTLDSGSFVLPLGSTTVCNVTQNDGSAFLNLTMYGIN